MKFLAFIQDVGGLVAIPSLNAPKAGFESAEDAVALSLEWENSVTAHIDAAMDLAVEKNDHATQVFLQWFVTEQVEEVKTMSELLQVVRRAGDRQPPAGRGLRGAVGGRGRRGAVAAGRRDAGALRARPLRGDDYPRARAVVDGWFGHPVGLVMHRLFFDQLGPSGVWLEDDEGRPGRASCWAW